MRTIKFFRQFLDHPVHIGAVAPSSRALATAAADWGKVSEASYVIELGSGTGAITGAVLDAMNPNAGFFGLEINPEFVEVFRERYPGVTIYEDSAQNAKDRLRENGRETCDTVVSGLPFAGFDDDLQDSLLKAIVDVLDDNGIFVTYSYLLSPYLPQGRKFRRKLESYFSSVEKSPLVWANLPPAFIYRGRK